MLTFTWLSEKQYVCLNDFINPIQDAHGWGDKKGHLPKICHTYPAMMKFGTVITYLRKTQKIYESRDTPFEFR